MKYQCLEKSRKSTTNEETPILSVISKANQLSGRNMHNDPTRTFPMATILPISVTNFKTWLFQKIFP
jgi:hypothetical protein